MQRANEPVSSGEKNLRNKKVLKQSVPFEDKGEAAQMSSTLLSISVLPVLRSQVKCSVKAMRKSNCQGIWAASERPAALCFLGTKRKFSELLS